MSMFQKATKRAIRARIALDGPSGAGKTWTALTFATAFGKRIALVDTERGSASLYADQFDFDVIEMSPPFHPDRLIEMIRAAEKEGYDTLVIDSLSHFWEGEGGVLDIVDAAGQRANGNTYAGWKTGSPILRHLIDSILGSDLHVIATMRAKQEYVLEQDSRGKMVPRKVGLAPVMRAGVEFEFTLVGDLDVEHRLTISKSRASILADQVIQPGRAGDAAEAFVGWMSSGAAVATREQIDALKQRMNKIEPREVRLAAKQAFADQFGNPDYLVADKLEAADAFIAGYEGAGADGAPFDEPEQQATSGTTAGPAGVVEEPAGDGQFHTLSDHPGSDTITTITAQKAQQLHRDLGRSADKPSGYGLAIADHEALIYNATKGRTVHASDLTEHELGVVYTLADQVKKGQRTLGQVHAANEAHIVEQQGVAS